MRLTPPTGPLTVVQMADVMSCVLHHHNEEKRAPPHRWGPHNISRLSTSSSPPPGSRPAASASGTWRTTPPGATGRRSPLGSSPSSRAGSPVLGGGREFTRSSQTAKGRGAPRLGDSRSVGVRTQDSVPPRGFSSARPEGTALDGPGHIRTCNEILLLPSDVQRHPAHSRRRSRVDKLYVLVRAFEHLGRQGRGEEMGAEPARTANKVGVPRVTSGGSPAGTRRTTCVRNGDRRSQRAR